MAHVNNVIYVGDFNINCLNEHTPLIRYFQSMLFSMKMLQMISDATHVLLLT